MGEKKACWVKTQVLGLFLMVILLDCLILKGKWNLKMEVGDSVNKNLKCVIVFMVGQQGKEKLPRGTGNMLISVMQR